MRQLLHIDGKTRRWQRLLAVAVLACLGLTGCRGALDDFSFKDFEFRTAFTKPDPLVVLRDSTDGDKRAWALGVLTEPKLKGGSDKDQDAVVQILSQAAVSENHILCRLAAIQSLSQFKDPCAVEGLKEAYYRASSMTPENATVVRCAALTALGRTGSPAALDLLVKVVGEPPVKGDTVAAQQSLDLRIAAARALGNYHQPQAADALTRVWQTEKDVALRDRAHESLEASLGRKVPVENKGVDGLTQQPEAQARVRTGAGAGRPIGTRIVPAPPERFRHGRVSAAAASAVEQSPGFGDRVHGWFSNLSAWLSDW